MFRYLARTLRSQKTTLRKVIDQPTLSVPSPFRRVTCARGSRLSLPDHAFRTELDRNNDAILADRPDIGNPNAPLSTRAIIFPRCASGYQNPDSGLCVSPGDVHWVEGVGFPNSSTVGRNTLRTGGTNNFDLNLTKSIPFGEARRVELRWEALNAFNHLQFVQVPPMSLKGSPAGRFLNRDFTDGGIRSMWVQVKLLF